MIAEAQKADLKAPGSHAVEALLLDFEQNRDEARAAYLKAVELGSTSAYAYFRLAGLMWRPDADRYTLVAIEKWLSRAVELNSRYASACSWLGEIRAILGAGESLGLIERAISLEPRDPLHRLRAAFVLAGQQKFEEARVQAQTALTLAGSEEERTRAQDVLARIGKASGG